MGKIAKDVMMNSREIPAELKRSFRIVEWSPLFLGLNIFLIFMPGICLATLGFFAIFFDGATNRSENIMIMLVSTVMTITGYLLMNWLDKMYFANLAHIARYGRDRTEGGIVQKVAMTDGLKQEVLLVVEAMASSLMTSMCWNNLPACPVLLRGFCLG